MHRPCGRLILTVLLMALAVPVAAQVGPAPSWVLTTGAVDSCVDDDVFLPGVSINVPSPLFASERGILSAPGFPNLGYTQDSSFQGVGAFGFTVFTDPYSLPANTPLTLKVTTFNQPNFAGGAAYVSVLTWNCTTGAIIDIGHGPGGTLTGRLVDQIPGVGPIVPNVVLQTVASDGGTTPIASLAACTGGATTSCVGADGTFSEPHLLPGTYLLRVSGTDPLTKLVNATVSGDTDIGNVGLVRRPFDVSVAVGAIPAAGGQIPVTVRVTTRWAVPTLPIVVVLDSLQDRPDTPSRPVARQSFNFTWPGGLADSGVVGVTQLSVSPTDPAGGSHCATVEIRWQANPQFVLGSGEHCSNKQP
ncbi:MAG: hypothetical protein AB7R67_11805 [Vicinamibacterales bacterium]